MKNSPFPSTMARDSGDEENGDEGQRFYRVGRMSTLFELLDNGKLSFEEICDFLGWQAEDVNDMYQGYQESRNMQKE